MFGYLKWKLENDWTSLLYKEVHFVLILVLLCVAEGQRPSEPVGTPNRESASRTKDPYATKDEKESGTKRSYRQTTPVQMSFKEECEYLAYYCLRAYKTGKLCGRTVYYRYQNFVNYCMLDYINCMERYEVWQVAHMGECFNVTILTDYMQYEYLDDHFLDVYYVIQD